jgi:phage repressor protein C with HTH and peptisase S24 domain
LSPKVKPHFLYSLKPVFMVRRAMSILGKKIAVARKRLRPKVTQAELAEVLGVTPQAVSGWERGDSSPEGAKIPVIAKTLKVSTDWLHDEADRTPPIVPEGNNLELSSQPAAGLPHSHGAFRLREMQSLHVGGGTMPLRGLTSAGEGVEVIDSEPIDYIPRSPGLEHVREAYALQVDGTSMVPALRPGFIVHVDPHRKARQGNLCVFRNERLDGTVYGCIKEYRKETADAWHVEQYNPPEGEKRCFALRKAEWTTVHVVVFIDPRNG